MVVNDLAVWCHDNDPYPLNVRKTKELIMDDSKRGAEHGRVHFDGAVVEQGESFKFLNVHITKELTWYTYQHSCEEGTTTPLPPPEG